MFQLYSTSLPAFVIFGEVILFINTQKDKYKYTYRQCVYSSIIIPGPNSLTTNIEDIC